MQAGASAACGCRTGWRRHDVLGVVEQHDGHQEEDGDAVGSGIISVEDDTSSLPPLIEDLVVVGEVTEHNGEVVVESTAENTGAEDEPLKEQKKEEEKDQNDHSEDSRSNEI